MFILSPSILAADFSNLGRDIRLADEAGAQYIHFDVMDGLFVPSISFGMPVLSAVRKLTDKVIDCHLMIMNPERYVNEFAKSGADIITFHYEACSDSKKVIDMIHGCGAKAGIAINPETDVTKVFPYLSEVDMVLIMTVKPGFGGQKYIDYCTEKVYEVRKQIEKLGLSVDVEVDGGIHLGNVETVVEAGANVIVAGSAIFKDDIAANVKAFLE